MGVERVSAAEDPAVSVVIPSVPGSDAGPTLSRLTQQTLAAPTEVIVVNDGSLDRSAARNRGLEAASAAVVALTDDDTRPPPKWLAVALREFREDSDLVCLEGPVYGGCRSRRPRRYVGCNLAVDRAAALGVGGFRSAFAAWGEDIEFGWRMEAEAEGRCRFVEDFRMCHPTVPRTPMDRDLERRLREEYPDRYDAIIAASRGRYLYRRARAAGLTQPLQRLINAVRFRSGEPCRPTGGAE